ncbi:hypothetical protein CsSME_00012425 [Camellia sinensis var. sinensis]
MSSCKPYTSPMATKHSSSSSTDDLPFSQPSLYRSLDGALQYMTITRPDLAFAVNHALVLLSLMLSLILIGLAIQLIIDPPLKQPTVSRSSSKAEYRALAQTSSELSWLGMLLVELHISLFLHLLFGVIISFPSP